LACDGVAADVFVMNSWCENFGLVTLEAMLARLKCRQWVTERRGISPEISRNKLNG